MFGKTNKIRSSVTPSNTLTCARGNSPFQAPLTASVQASAMLRGNVIFIPTKASQFRLSVPLADPTECVTIDICSFYSYMKNRKACFFCMHHFDVTGNETLQCNAGTPVAV